MMSDTVIPQECISEKRVVAGLFPIAGLSSRNLYDVRERREEEALRNHMVIRRVEVWTLRSDERYAAICTGFSAYHMSP